jgi:hypothetical protein
MGFGELRFSSLFFLSTVPKQVSFEKKFQRNLKLLSNYLTE